MLIYPSFLPVILLQKVWDGGDGLLVDERVHVGEVLAQDALPQPHEVAVGRELGWEHTHMSSAMGGGNWGSPKSR